MSYAEKFLKARGQNAVIERTPPLNTRVSIKRSTKASRDLGIREGYWEGLVLYESTLLSGEIISICDEKYLVQSVNYDHASLECAFFSAKCNAVVQHKRLLKDVDEHWNPVTKWRLVDEGKPFIHCYGEIVTYRLRQEDPGLLEQTRYILQISKSVDIKELDRIVLEGENYQIESIDPLALSGVVRVQLGIDVRD